MTPEREKRLWSVIRKRQGNLTVVLENVHDPHNIFAVLRSCDSVGVQEVYLIGTKLPDGKRAGKRSSAGVRKWLDIYQYDTVEECMRVVKSRYEKVYTTYLHASSKSLYELDLTQSVALVFGNEHSGVSEEMLEWSDGNFLIPQVGMAKSLNISVACAVTLYEAYRQRNLKGFYHRAQLPESRMNEIFQRWKLREEKGDCA